MGTLTPLMPSGDAMTKVRSVGERVPQSAVRRLSRPGAVLLADVVAASLADRVSAGHTSSNELLDAVAGLSEEALLELAHHALEAALEALDSEPALTADLLPGTTNSVRAQIARGCIGEQVLRTQGYVVAEIDFEVWEQLLDADLRSAPPDTLGADETAEREKSVLADLGIRHAELARYRADRRVRLALSDLGSLTDSGPVTS
jgi:hypothetical protein